ncbi:MAG: methyltransferase domain-containing protein, partial [Burkholderiales bacterium]
MTPGRSARCTACGTGIEPGLDLGRMPLANGFLRAEDFASERFFPLRMGICPKCALAQLLDVVAPQDMFHDRYPFQTASSERMRSHFRAFARRVAASLADDSAFVVDIGSNDGTLLKPLADAGFRHLGIDPCANVVEIARKSGVDSVCRFFDQATARDIVLEHGMADVVLAANCLCHIPDLQSLGEGLRLLLK